MAQAASGTWSPCSTAEAELAAALSDKRAPGERPWQSCGPSWLR